MNDAILFLAYYSTKAVHYWKMKITRDDTLIICREQMTGRKTYTLNFRTIKKRC